MKVALIGPGDAQSAARGWGAIQRVLCNIEQRSRAAGFEATVIAATEPERIAAACSALQPDVVHLHDHRRLRACLPYLQAHPTPLVMTSHDYRLGHGLPREVVPSIELADAVVALSPSIRDRLAAVRPAGVHYIPNGVDTEVFRPLAKDPQSVVAVGRNTPRKRFAEIAAFFLEHPRYRLTLCGPDMRERSGRVPIIPTGPNITLLDDQPQAAVAALFGRAEFFVHLCEEEACPLVVREAMAAGCRAWTVPQCAQGLENVALSWRDAVADPELGVRAAAEARDRLDWAGIVTGHAGLYTAVLEQWQASADRREAARRRVQELTARDATLAGRLGRMREWMAPQLRRVASVVRRVRRLAAPSRGPR